MGKKLYLAILLGLSAICGFAENTDEKGSAKDANNPLATIKSFSVHNIYSPSICGMDGNLNTAWLRYAQPIGRVLIRASLPINTVSIPEINNSGLGDLNLFATYIVTKPSSPNQFGLGPMVSMPTATSSVLGSGKWMAGVALVGYFAGNDIFQCGFLATWQHSFAGSEKRAPVHVSSIQPFLMWQLKKGFYLRSTGNAILDFQNNNYLVPIGLGVGKIITINKVICNLFFEPQFAVYNYGKGLPRIQLFLGINTQF